MGSLNLRWRLPPICRIQRGENQKARKLWKAGKGGKAGMAKKPRKAGKARKAGISKIKIVQYTVL